MGRYYSTLASLATSFFIALVFYVLALEKTRLNPQFYTNVDIFAGMAFVFILSMIVSASIWPGIIARKNS